MAALDTLIGLGLTPSPYAESEAKRQVLANALWHVVKVARDAPGISDDLLGRIAHIILSEEVENAMEP